MQGKWLRLARKSHNWAERLPRSKETQDRDDTAAVMEKYSEGSARLRGALYDPENGIYNRTGKNAVGVAADVQQTSEGNPPIWKAASRLRNKKPRSGRCGNAVKKARWTARPSMNLRKTKPIE